MEGQWNHKIFTIKKEGFTALALEIFNYQAIQNPVYKAFITALGIDATVVNSISAIPFLPIRFFKSHEVKTGVFTPQTIFESSGTTGSINSRHFVKDLSLYEESFIKAFELFYGPVKECCILGLLPSYLERNNSSLVYMTQKLIQLSEHPDSGFYLDDFDKLFTTLAKLEEANQKVLLIGVTFALLDFAEKYSLALKSTNVLETGGMKGRRAEIIRPEVHALLKKSFAITHIHSEYGMTELLSQAYSKGDGIFNCPPWMKVMLRDEEDPFHIKQHGSGAINIIDMANVHSCSFIATDDAGKLYADGSFEVSGRMDGSDLRGCSLMTV